ncbi:MAG: c-type cytochrome [Verrucomicrobiaceae bacterium]
MKFPILISALAISALSFAHAEDKDAVIAHGKTKFMLCAACHGMDGAGLKLGPTMMMAPAYKGSAVVDGDPELLALVIMKGIKKEGTAFAGVMAPLEAGLNDKDLAGVLTYLRNEYSEKKDLITEAQVAGWRTKYADRKDPVTRAEIDEHLKKAAEAK